MNIIGGSAKGQKIFAPKNIQPTRGLVREAIFSIIQVKDRSFLDLYSGSGGVGIEALSRGATRVIFVEKSRKVSTYIRRNLDKTGFEAVIINRAVQSALRTLNESFDFVFMDPPYRSNLIEKTLNRLDPVLKKDSLVIVEHRTGYNPTHNGFEVVKNKIYGDTSLLILRK